MVKIYVYSYIIFDDVDLIYHGFLYVANLADIDLLFSFISSESKAQQSEGYGNTSRGQRYAQALNDQDEGNEINC